jgi:cytidine deaminase
MEKKYHDLAKIAKKIRLTAHAPFSTFKVGSAILSSDGKIFTGCNIENSSYSLTICAERVAIFKAISEGVKKFEAIALVSDDLGFTPPCGACRQVLFELAGNIDLIMMNSKNQFKIVKLASLLPLAFTRKNLKQSLKHRV